MQPRSRGIAAVASAMTSVVLLATALTLVPESARDVKIWIPLTPEEHQAVSMKAMQNLVQPIPWWRIW